MLDHKSLERLHRTGPEFDGLPSNHGPMVVEVLERRGHGDAITRWTDRYSTRLDDMPRPTAPIEPLEWRDALGQPQRAADWIDYFQRQAVEQPWRTLLATWWPRLLSGIADQQGGVGARLAQLDAVDGWSRAVAGLVGIDDVADVPDRLARIVVAAVCLSPRYARRNPTMLVHAGTAPNAVLRTLPLLPHELWPDSLAAAWSAGAALVSAYAQLDA